MTHAKCTKETVFEAADQLLADGENPPSPESATSSVAARRTILPPR
ncbi:MAG: hypothetical protein ACXWT4_17440 [Methylobacter sp.]